MKLALPLLFSLFLWSSLQGQESRDTTQTWIIILKNDNQYNNRRYPLAGNCYTFWKPI